MKRNRLISRQRKHNSFFLSTFSVIVAALLAVYSFFIEPAWLDTKIYKVPGQVSGRLRIVQISDLHLNGNGRIEDSLIAAISKLNPELVVLTGDVVDTDEDLQSLEIFLKRLTGVNKIAVLGNWEYWSGIDQAALKKVYEQNGVSLLVNNETSLSFDGMRLGIIGLDDYTAGKPSEPRIQSNGNFRLLLQHSPGYFDQKIPQQKMNGATYDLCLSGHTHAGQVTLFGLPLWTPHGSGKFVAGWYKTKKCPLYVSRGVGTSILPIRFGARPELSVFEIGRSRPPL